ncbi:unnamed protein product [Camellia sinensis]
MNVMGKCEPLQMSKQQKVEHDQCKCKVGLVALGVLVESTVVPIVEHVTLVLMPKPNVVAESTVVPTVEHVTHILLSKPNVVVASKNMEENRISLTPSILKLGAHLDEQTKQAKNKIKVRLNNKRRKKIPKLQLIDESSSSTGPYGGPCTQCSPFTAITSKKRKANQKVPTKTKLDLDEVDSSLYTKEDKFDQDIMVMELFYKPVELATRFRFVLIRTKTWICGSKFDTLERFRLLVDLVNDLANHIYIEVMDRLERYKERYSRLRKARRKKKD